MTRETLTRIGFCPHCCNRAPQAVIAVHTCKEIVWFESDDAKDEEVDFDGTYFVATCGTCHQLLLYWEQGDPANEGPSGPLDYFRQSGLIWPEAALPKNAVPAPVAAIYQEAAVVKRLSANSFAVQIRRALEAVCADRGASGRSLYEMLTELARRGDLPPVLVEMTDVLRLLGNVGAHASDRTVRPSQVDALDEFFRAVIEYVYIAPARLRRFRDTLKGFDSVQDET
jgi:uncharacterized protein DUF4145